MAENHDYFMAFALDAARAAGDRGEVPVGAALVINGHVESDHNRTIEFGDPSAHAEALVLSRAARAGLDLGAATLYVTLEPCIMCAGAIVLSRI
ncbi:MAG TPA: nucleoside deaminase, partial [Myxococcota bacterium]|nr:nucleoside deaminase [Myxococcota bacterium]